MAAIEKMLTLSDFNENWYHGVIWFEEHDGTIKAALNFKAMFSAAFFHRQCISCHILQLCFDSQVSSLYSLLLSPGATHYRGIGACREIGAVIFWQQQLCAAENVNFVYLLVAFSQDHYTFLVIDNYYANRTSHAWIFWKTTEICNIYVGERQK